MWTNSTIIQKKVEIEEDYEGKQESIIFILGNLLPKLTVNISFYGFVRVTLKSPKHSSSLLRSLLRAHSTSMSLAPISHALLSAGYCQNFHITNGKIPFDVFGSLNQIYLWPIVMITQCRENLEIWKDILDGGCHISNHIYDCVCWEFMYRNVRRAIPEKETESERKINFWKKSLDTHDALL